MFMRPLFPVNGDREFLEEFSRFLGSVKKTVAKFSECLRAFCEGKESVSRLSGEVDALETEADEARRKVERIVFSRFVTDKENTIELVEKIDDVADAAESAAWDMDIRPVRISPEMSEILVSCGKELEILVSDLVRCVSDLSDPASVVKYSESVKKRRDRVRKMVHDLRHLIFSLRDHKDLVILSDLSEKIIKIADSAEEAADRASIIAVRI